MTGEEQRQIRERKKPCGKTRGTAGMRWGWKARAGQQYQVWDGGRRSILEDIRDYCATRMAETP